MKAIAAINAAIAKYVWKRKRNGTRNKRNKYMVPPAGAGVLG
jgi:hypothetical protein